MVSPIQKRIVAAAGGIGVIALVLLIVWLSRRDSPMVQGNAAQSTVVTMAMGTKVEVPGDWEVAQRTDLPAGAVFASLKGHDMGVIVQEEAKKDLPKEGLSDMSLQKYASLVRDSMANDMKDPSTANATHVMLGDKDCLRFDISGFQENLHIHYEFIICDLGTAFVRAAAWGDEDEFQQQAAKVDAFMQGIHW